ncbi:MAG: hypothetical protein FD166_1798 [Bacteroidetes bacterium]|nr:MAG: hypothetical protein FD166_1798 [Bacteroidota bacterium]
MNENSEISIHHIFSSFNSCGLVFLLMVENKNTGSLAGMTKKEWGRSDYF